MSCFQILPLGNSVVIQLGTAELPLRNSVTGTTDTGATVACTLLNANDAAVVGGTWPVSMPHSAGGVYRATLPATLELTHGASYTALISVTGSGAEVGRFEVECIAQTRAR